MRLLSVILLACIIFLSSFGGMIKTVPPEKTDCCKKMANTACPKKRPEKKQTKDCGQPGCATMFACSICGFIVQEPLTVQPVYANIIPKPVAQYITGDIAAYHADNWKPPKIC